MPLPQIRRRTNQQATRRAKRCSREVNQENSITRNNPANQISSGIQNTRTSLLEANLKPLTRSCETESKLNPRFETKATSLRVKRSEIRTAPSPRTFPLPLSPNTMYSFVRIGVRLENHLSFSVMWREQPESMIHLFSKPPTSSKNLGRAARCWTSCRRARTRAGTWLSPTAPRTWAWTRRRRRRRSMRPYRRGSRRRGRRVGCWRSSAGPPWAGPPCSRRGARRDMIPWLSWLDPHGYIGRMKRMSKVLDRFAEHVLQEHTERRQREGEVFLALPSINIAVWFNMNC